MFIDIKTRYAYTMVQPLNTVDLGEEFHFDSSSLLTILDHHTDNYPSVISRYVFQNILQYRNNIIEAQREKLEETTKRLPGDVMWRLGGKGEPRKIFLFLRKASRS